ncbi:hypothetical protein AN639_03735 [Candidatus Epulonipiscium fishelsonii]|uniref:Uncharacterized protein n=1 Tax=Candidatus Epulonipiscium fishelsonii TaxID=77094 RepID=A0ACC8X6Q6_9FIRM|nr:hypothetical protein AN396_12790 [Epulopiscium sp. SCG-B11WGA-EpuloA1]ONI41473.1 hypothetical protein AN639_03735 [Epulopiscium sp. SCG-B05WGA-EpuloA1]
MNKYQRGFTLIETLSCSILTALVILTAGNVLNLGMNFYGDQIEYEIRSDKIESVRYLFDQEYNNATHIRIFVNNLSLTYEQEIKDMPLEKIEFDNPNYEKTRVLEWINSSLIYQNQVFEDGITNLTVSKSKNQALVILKYFINEIEQHFIMDLAFKGIENK